jgi:hypothetical protein
VFEDSVSSPGSVLLKGVPLNVTKPPVTVRVTAPQLAELPRLAAPHERLLGLAESDPFTAEPETLIVGLPTFEFTVSVEFFVPAAAGLN